MLCKYSIIYLSSYWIQNYYLYYIDYDDYVYIEIYNKSNTYYTTTKII